MRISFDSELFTARKNLLDLTNQQLNREQIDWVYDKLGQLIGGKSGSLVNNTFRNYVCVISLVMNEANNEENSPLINLGCRGPAC